MKMRFDIEFTIPLHVGAFIEHNFVMKYISYVKMGDNKYEKPDGDSNNVQSFYYFISNNSMKVTEIMMQNGTHFFLKNKKLHSYDTYCYNNPMFKFKYYAINGRILDSQETIFFERKLKMKKLKDKIK